MNRYKALLASITVLVLIFYHEHAFCDENDIKPDVSMNSSPSSVEILSRSADVYKHLDSYQDHGVAISKSPKTARELHFTTAYSRSGKFRFEFWEKIANALEYRHVVWRNGNDVKSWHTLGLKVESHESFGMAIAAATGISVGTAYTIPSVLMEEAEWKGWTWTSPKGTYRVEDGVENNTPCFRIQRLTSTNDDKDDGIAATKGKETYWITKDLFLLVRMDQEWVTI